jgi:hypothetical protein
MNTKVVTGIVVVLALVVVGWWYLSMMAPTALAPQETDMNPEESVNGVAESDEATRAKLVGSWKSTEDAKFVRVFSANGTVTDTYEGNPDATVIGEWSFVLDPASEQPTLPVVKDGKVLKIQFPEEALYFAVTGVSDTNLSMTYLSGNGVLEFTRM